jgi:membrane protease YdiL (CAAX protease family)
VLGLSTFVFGLGAALIAGLTGRIGESIIAHVVFNVVFTALNVK